jgi:pyruvate ferredoxin oxidoreductase delta subunit
MVDASRIAMDTLGVAITNTAIIGALIKTIGTISLEAMIEPFKHRFGRLAEKNLVAMKEAFDETKIVQASADGEETCTLHDPADWDVYISQEALYPWPEVEIGCDVHRPGSCSEFQTGNWRTEGYPLKDQERCISCGICWIVCPDMAFRPKGKDSYSWDERYCKGCGICVAACPKHALSMEEDR